MDNTNSHDAIRQVLAFYSQKENRDKDILTHHPDLTDGSFAKDVLKASSALLSNDMVEASIVLANTAYRIYEKLGMKEDAIEVIYHFSHIYIQSQDYSKAEHYSRIALTYYQESGLVTYQLDAILNCAIAIFELHGSFDKQARFLEEYLDLYESNQEIPQTASIYSILGRCYNEMKQPNQALEYFLKADTCLKLLGPESAVRRIANIYEYGNLLVANIENSNAEKLIPIKDIYQQFDHFEYSLKESLEIATKLGLMIFVVLILELLGKVNNAAGEVLKAIQIWKQAASATQKIQTDEQLAFLRQFNVYIDWSKAPVLYRILDQIIKTATDNNMEKVLKHAADQTIQLAESEKRPDWAFSTYMRLTVYYQWLPAAGDRWRTYFNKAENLVPKLPKPLQDDWYRIYKTDEFSWADNLNTEGKRLLAAKYRSQADMRAAIGILNSVLTEDRERGDTLGVLQDLDLLFLCKLDIREIEDARLTLFEMMDIANPEKGFNPDVIRQRYLQEKIEHKVPLKEIIFEGFSSPLTRLIAIVHRITEVDKAIIENLLGTQAFSLTLGGITKFERAGIDPLTIQDSSLRFIDPTVSINYYMAHLALILLEQEKRALPQSNSYKAAAKVAIATQQGLLGNRTFLEKSYLEHIPLLLCRLQAIHKPDTPPHWLSNTLLSCVFFVDKLFPTFPLKNELIDTVSTQTGIALDHQMPSLIDDKQYKNTEADFDQNKFLSQRILSLQTMHQNDQTDEALVYGKSLWVEVCRSGALMDKFLTANVLMTLFMEIKDYTKAEQFVYETISLAEIIGDNTKLFVAQAKLAWIYAHTGRFENAMVIIDQTISRIDSLGDSQDDRVNFANILSESGYLLFNRGENRHLLDNKRTNSELEKLVEYQKVALTIHREYGLFASIGLDFAYLAQLETGRDLDVAENYAEKALANLDRLLDSNEKARVRIVARMTYAQICLMQIRQFTPDNLDRLAQIRNLLLGAINDVQQLQKKYANEFDQLSYAREKASIYDLLIEVLFMEVSEGLERNTQEETEKYVWRLYAATQLKKSGVLNQRLALIKDNSELYHLLRKESFLSAQIENLEGQFINPRNLSELEDSESAEGQSKLIEAGRELAKVRHILGKNRISLKIDTSFLDRLATAIKEFSKRNTNYNYIDFHLSPYFKSFSFWIHGSSLRYNSLNYNAIETATQGYLTLISNPNVELSIEFIKVGQLLFDQLFDSFFPEFPSGERLIILPDAMLHKLPFEGLHTKESTLDKPQYFVEKDLVISYDVSMITIMLNQNLPEHRFKPKSAFAGFARSSFHEFRPYTWSHPLHDLRYTEDEVLEAARNFVDSKVFINDQCSVKNFKEVLASGTEILHVSSHAIIDDRRGVGIVLGLPNTDEENGAVIYYKDLYSIEGNVHTVVLSACHTGIGVTDESEGIIGFVRGFHFMGARCIITSLWSVEDKSTAVLMRHFYDHLLDGVTASEALRYARLNMLNQSTHLRADTRGIKSDYIDTGMEYSHPYYWAGFVVHDSQ